MNINRLISLKKSKKFQIVILICKIIKIAFKILSYNITSPICYLYLLYYCLVFTYDISYFTTLCFSNELKIHQTRNGKKKKSKKKKRRKNSKKR